MLMHDTCLEVNRLFVADWEKICQELTIESSTETILHWECWYLTSERKHRQPVIGDEDNEINFLVVLSSVDPPKSVGTV